MSEEKEEETFLYFAYGSNMLTQRIRINNPSARFVINILKCFSYTSFLSMILRRFFIYKDFQVPVARSSPSPQAGFQS